MSLFRRRKRLRELRQAREAREALRVQEFAPPCEKCGRFPGEMVIDDQSSMRGNPRYRGCEACRAGLPGEIRPPTVLRVVDG